jgi:general secretion pathway protein J
MNMRGYTLVEVLVAVLVFAVMAASAYVALDGLSRAAESHRDHAEQLGELQLAVARFDADLRQMTSRPVRDAQGQRRPALVGDRARLTATRAGWGNPGQVRRGNLQRFSWQVGDGRLVRTWWPVTDAIDATGAYSEPVLAVRGLAFRYRDHESRWHDQWPVGDQPLQILPTAIEVEIQTEHFGVIRRLQVLFP